MSTIAWDGKTLAADRKITSGNLQEQGFKISRLKDGTILAWVGGMAEGLVMVDWYKNGADALRYPAFQSDTNRFTCLIVVKPNGECLEYEHGYVPLPVNIRMAWGSGRGYAIAAMECGVDAIKAIEVASKFDPSSGFGVDSFSVEVVNGN